MQAKLADALPHVFPSLRFHTIDLGSSPPTITNIRILPVAAPVGGPPAAAAADAAAASAASASYASFSSSASSLSGHSLSAASFSSSLPSAAAGATAPPSASTPPLATSLRFVCDVTYANDCTITLGVTSAPSGGSAAADGSASGSGASALAQATFRRLAAKLSAAATFGVSRLTLAGTAEVSLSPLLPRLPLAGGVAVGFANPPALGMTFSGLAAAADLTATVAAPVRRVVDEVLSAFAVLPNRVAFSLSGTTGGRGPDGPPPLGVLRVRVASVRGLDPGVDPGGVAVKACLGDAVASLPPGGAAADFLVVSPRQALRLAVTDAGRASAPLLGRGWVEAGPLLAGIASAGGRPTKVEARLAPPWAAPIGVSPPTPSPTFTSSPGSRGGSGSLSLAVTALGLSSDRMALPGAVATLLSVVVGAVGGLPLPPALPPVFGATGAGGGGGGGGGGGRRRRLRAALSGGGGGGGAASAPLAEGGPEAAVPPPPRRKVLVRVHAPGQSPRVTASASLRPEASGGGGDPPTGGAATEGVFFFLLPSAAAVDPAGLVHVVVADAGAKGGGGGGADDPYASSDASGGGGAAAGLTDVFVALEDVVSRPGMVREEVFLGAKGGTVRLRLTVAAVGA